MNRQPSPTSLERVFVIDDEERISSLCGKILSRSGYEVIAPPYGPDALELARKGDYDLLLTDYNMPDTTGTNLYREIRASGHDVSAVLITANATADILTDALDAGVSAFISKPFTTEELRRGVEIAFAKVRMQRENARLRSIVALLEMRLQMAGLSAEDDVFDLVTDLTSKKIVADRVSMMIQSGTPSTLKVASSRGIEGMSKGALTDTTGSVAGYVLENGRSVLINQKNVSPDLLPRLRFDTLSSGICVPLRTDKGIVGVLSASRSKPGMEFQENDLQFLEGFAARISMPRDERLRFDLLRDRCLGGVMAMIEEIEAVEPWQKGHAARVTSCAERIALAMGLSETDIDEIRVAATIHDVGRLGIPEHQRMKKEVWSVFDMFRMKNHVQLGEKILKSSLLPDSILKAVRHHHEWFGGNGYPDGLRAEAIPLAARIIRVADTADAIASDRAHRSRFSASEFREELIRGRGVQFDPIILETALRLHDESRLLASDHPYYLS